MRFYLPLTRRSRISVGPAGMALIAVVYLLWVPVMALIWLTVTAAVLAIRLIVGVAELTGNQYRARQARTPTPGK